MSIANSNFEEWTIENRTLDLSKFHYDLSKMSLDGALFDEDKLVYFCKEVLAKERKETLLPKVSEWSKEFDSELYKKIEDDPLYFGKILDIEKDRPNPRKDYAKYSDIAPATAAASTDTPDIFFTSLSFLDLISLVTQLPCKKDSKASKYLLIPPS